MSRSTYVANTGVAHQLVHAVVPGQGAEVAQCRVARVEQAGLHQLVVADVGDEADPDLVQRRAAVAEGVLDEPLGERLGDDRPAVVDAVAGGEGGPLLGRGLRGDPVDHAAGEGHPVGDPAGEHLVAQPGEADDGGAGGLAVAVQVVAGDDGERRQARLPTPVEGLDQVAEDGGRGVRLGQVAVDVGVVGGERAGLRVEQVAVGGDGEGDQTGARVAQPVEDGRGVVGGVEVVDHHADDAGALTVGTALDDGVEVVLRGECVLQVPLPQADADDAPPGGDAPLGELVEVDELVGAGEAARR
jgi:hypothetical protein